MADNDASVEEIRFRNPAKQVGFAQLYHVATLDREISDGALRTFLLYLKYAQQKVICWPSRERLARERGVRPVTLSRHNAELVKAGYITRKRRMNKSSLTSIEDYEQVPRLKVLAEGLIAERIKNDMNDVSEMIPATYQKRYVEEESIEEEPIEETPAPPGAESSPSPGEQQVERLRQRFGRDPLELMQNCHEAQVNSEVGDWTVPAEAGGGDGLGEAMLAAWCSAKRLKAIPHKLAAKWRRRLAKLAAEMPGLSPAMAVQAVATVLDPENPQFNYYRYNGPANKKFEADWRDVALELMSGGSQKTEKRKWARGKRREYEPCTEAERAAAWRLYGDWVQEFVVQAEEKMEEEGALVVHVGAHLIHTAAMLRLGIDERQAQALVEAFSVWKAENEEPIDVEAFFKA